MMPVRQDFRNIPPIPQVSPYWNEQKSTSTSTPGARPEAGMGSLKNTRNYQPGSNPIAPNMIIQSGPATQPWAEASKFAAQKSSNQSLARPISNPPASRISSNPPATRVK